MRKLVFFLFLCIVVLLTAKRSTNHHVSFNTLLYYNVEALAAGEDLNVYRCVGSGSVDCPIIHDKVKYVFGGYSLEE
ncbi:NVEALA domain-containing protein [Bacteroides sp. AN502(2024)]|uniref:NVEALA domain-containing protein n=1 Tax=Bacteroides sp. AN502(2024) TaxID=3160599 RepID=UPI003517A6A7